MKPKRDFLTRYIALGAIFVVGCLIFIARLINIQIAGQDYYKSTSASVSDVRTRTVKIHAVRGEIYDRNGKPLVVNKYTYNVNFDKGSMPGGNAGMNLSILNTLANVFAAGAEDKLAEIAVPIVGSYPDYSYDYSYIFDETNRKKFDKFLTLMDQEDDVSCEDLCRFLMLRYGLIKKDSNLTKANNGTAVYAPQYSDEEINVLLKYRWFLEQSGFASNAPFCVLSDADIKLITMLKEASIRGINIVTVVERVYCEPGYASHILGRVGKIQAGAVEYYTELGYPLDAVVGISGTEQAFEQYLRGVDGEMTITEDSYGNILSQEITKEPEAGHNIRLTIDIDMQKIAETALADNIKYIANKGLAGGQKLSGEDANAGALTVVDIPTGDVLALASYPTYDLSLFNENFETLNTDPLSPMFNRALEGQYPPGSTFKLATAAAALTEGIITPDTKIKDEGIYSFYENSDHKPRCWIYLKYGTTHGTIELTKAIQVSCNYYFFEVGRLLGITKLNQYCRQLGLGEKTGIELNEKTGILAGPDYRDENGLDQWSPGDTLAAAIGQSDNLFTPLQISVYMAALVNSGTRFRSHILRSVHEFYTDSVTYETVVEVEGVVNLSSAHRNVLLNAMKSVTTDDGSAARIFSNYPIVVGGKTGTAQRDSTKSDNAIFTAFAPFDSPQISVTCVIEQGANGTDAGLAVKDIFDYYFGLRKN